MNRAAKAKVRQSFLKKALTEKHAYLCRLISYGVVFVLLFFNLIINIFNYHQQSDTNNLLRLNSEEKQTFFSQPSPAATSRLPENTLKDLKTGLTAGSFGDGFSSLAWINSGATDLFFDSEMTAFYFPPKYTYQKIKDCSSDSECPLDLAVNACRGQQCLTVSGDQLFFAGHHLDWPSEDFSGARVSVGLLDKKWLVGAIVGDDQDKKIVVYSFDGQKFSPVLGVDQTVIPRYPNYHGHLSFGGVDNDFLILYAGYEGLAYHFKNGQSEDVSQYFGIRVSDGGFDPRITRIASGSETFWYITSATTAKPKLIKLWQDGTGSIQGAASFTTPLFFGRAPQQTSFKLVSQNQQGRDFIIIQDYGPNLAHQQWQFTDNGFDNSQDRKVVSNNLITVSNEQIGFAKPAKVDLNLGLGEQVSASGWGNYALFQFSNNGVDWLGANLGEEIMFTDSKGQGLYWRAQFKKGENQEYSPFFGNFNNLEYYFRVL